MLCDRGKELSRLRCPNREPVATAAGELIPGHAKKDLTTLQAQAILAAVGPWDIAGKTRA